MSSLILLMLLLTILSYIFIIEPLILNPLSKIPGPPLHALTKWRLALDDWSGSRTRRITALHARYGPVVRIGPNEIHFNSLSALRTIYGAGSGYERTAFYDMFDVYGRKNLFTFHSSRQHADRKKLLANAYSKSTMLKPVHAQMIQEKVAQYLTYLEKLNGPDEIFASLHYFSIDAITAFVYGPKFGGTSAMAGNATHRALLNDILHHSRRRLSWFAVHLKSLTRWMYTRVGVLESLLTPLLPMPKPATYTGIRIHALQAWQSYKAYRLDPNTPDPLSSNDSSIISLLFKQHTSQSGSLEDLDLASECADHLLAGIDTTADTLMFLIWALSLPLNAEYQSKLIAELASLPAETFNNGVPSVETADKLIYLNAIIKETLRLYAPLPATEPRSLPINSIIDGYAIPRNTVVGMSPFALHRNEDVFESPRIFNPERWLIRDESKLAEMNRWFWAFSSGGRMCIGLHLAMAEMTTLVAAVYRRYGTRVEKGREGVTPAITSRFELFFDEVVAEMKEHECLINFVPLNADADAKADTKS